MIGADLQEPRRKSWLVACRMGSLPDLMSCKSRAEAFARRLQTKLRSLSGLITNDDAGDTREETVGADPIEKMTHEDSQPITDDEELYYDFDLASSSCSPSSPDPTSCSPPHAPILTQPFNITMKANYAVSDVTWKQSVETQATSLTRESQGDERDGAHDASVLEQGQSNHSSQVAGEEDKYSSKGFITLSILGLKVDDGQTDEPVNGELSFNGKEEEKGEEEEEVTELASPLWGTLKQIDRFQVRKAKDKSEDIEESQEISNDQEAQPKMPVEEVEETLFTTDSIIPYEKDTEDDDDQSRPKHIYRSSSLKTGKTPPGTPGRKKIVRFADVLGLDLEDVRHVFLEDLPTVPKSAFSDLDNSAVMQPNECQFNGTKPQTTLVVMFSQPYLSSNFLERVRTQKVCLENAVACDGSVKGQIRVLNLSFNKQLFVRYTLNEWRTYVELETNYLPNSNDGLTDRFNFVIYGGDKLNLGQRIIFCIRYVTLGAEFWDNNYGHNYQFQCLQECMHPPVEVSPLGLMSELSTSFMY